MGWIVGTVLFFIVIGIAVIVGLLAGPNGRRADGTESYTRAIAYVIALACTVGWLALTFAESFYVINAGHVGVVKTFGAIDGQVGDGATLIKPWSDITVVSTQARRKEFDNLNAFSKETQDVFVDATLNLAVAPDDVQCLYRTVGANWYDTLIPPRVLQTLKDETVKYSTVQVAPHREAIRAAVKQRLQQQLSNFSVRPGACHVAIDVQDFLLRNIDFRPEFKQAIERKQIATQDAQTARNRVAQAQAEADQKVAEASGTARATLVNADAQAKANKKLAASVTPELIQFQAVQKLAPNVTTVLLPSNSNFLLPSSVFGSGK